MEGMNTIVIGSLNTDLVATGIKKFPKPGEHVYGKELVIGPGGKSRNIADMIARLMPKDSVSMVGRTVKDSYGLWKPPVDSLVEAGVNIDYIVMTESNDKLQGIALNPVDTSGNNQIIVFKATTLHTKTVFPVDRDDGAEHDNDDAQSGPFGHKS